MSLLRDDEKRSLLRIARKAIETALTHAAAPQTLVPPGNLAEHRGAFVTLHCRRRLRGCIGRVVSAEPLASVIAECAVAAATDDPRFRRLELSDLRNLQIELSVLSDAKRATPEEVQPGIHGLIVSLGDRRGVLLPQVAVENRWTREQFLEETCRKAGLVVDAWQSPGTHIEIFTAEVFSEEGGVLSSNGGSASNAGAYSNSQ